MIKYVDDGDVYYDIGFLSNFSDIMIVEVQTHQLKLVPRSTCQILWNIFDGGSSGGNDKGVNAGTMSCGYRRREAVCLNP